MGCNKIATTGDVAQMKQQMRKSSGKSKSPGIIERYVQRKVLEVAMPVIPPLLRSRVGKLTYEMGKEGEKVAAEILSEQHNIRITAIAKSTGVDVEGRNSSGKTVAVEVKTSSSQNSSFQKMLGNGYGHRQCSDGWLEALGYDPKTTDVMGMLIDVSDPDRPVGTLYKRVDSNANSWVPIRKNIPIE